MNKIFKYASIGEIYTDLKANIFDIETYDKNVETKLEQRPINSELS